MMTTTTTTMINTRRFGSDDARKERRTMAISSFRGGREHRPKPTPYTYTTKSIFKSNLFPLSPCTHDRAHMHTRAIKYLFLSVLFIFIFYFTSSGFMVISPTAHRKGRDTIPDRPYTIL